MLTPDSPESLIKKTAYEIGFSLVGITDLSPCPESDSAFENWLEAGNHGEMHYLERWKEKHCNPSLLLEDAKSAVCVALNYYTKALARNLALDGSDGRGIFSIYAHGRDYHDVMGEMLSALSMKLAELFPGWRSVACADTKPVSDRAFAIRSGIAWLGKNTNVISPKYGSWIFLGELITNLEMTPDAPLESLCSDCTLCIDACPAGALGQEYSMDARKCISYLTIEKRGEIPKDFHGAIGLNVFGCDECQRVCPYNAVAVESILFSSEERNRMIDMELQQLAEIGDKDFKKLAVGSVISRCGTEGLRRNAAIALANIASGRFTSKGKKR
ncbi:MAG: tRNA epoxyqueuosine(34) reductase QueG [Candidatus Latescibacteria bacterium]|nr:tRNA epoxyqueuosine(34) reductase QueG [Candidatus Latescibacterota bacterium]NIM21956.1 tRNA epoxyqueuosine(34) reductase QueG [Candidatus Latescibacterota bacterium]NIM65974.1 tRNA epoxyqueuosine(34) reductase QueG [Candidatus Latescibacterota bacterium]NIO02382.1 tRNA epoxyqueuosine(34) reductase QueG [Candidatus Latescibacterota bacterium]NIO29292.1 tRNA epoxyqueuosine(34) reductase QueG [Candidatus Latescibacterota bacterium]